jgi:hypothetical protein
MSLLTGFNISLNEVALLGQASQAAFIGGTIPAGWKVVTPDALGLGSQYSDGNYFTDPTSGASAIVLTPEQVEGSSYIVAFRGADDPIDILHNPELLTGSYIHHYDPLLNALRAPATLGAAFAFTGASLGGAATNLMANIAGSAFGGAFAGATFVGFASLNINTASGILNLWFENDPVYKSINGYADFSSSLDNFVLATSQYMGGNYNGLLPPDLYAHDLALGFDALSRLSQSVFYDVMTPDSVVIFDANDGLVQDVTPGRENTGAFYLGENVADSIAGRNGTDFLEGFAGDDTLSGAAGNDRLDGGTGFDVALYSGSWSSYGFTWNGNTSWNVTDWRQNSPDGSDINTNIEQLRFSEADVMLGYSSGNAAATIFDTASVQPWTYTLHGYDAQSRLDYNQVSYDDGALYAIDYDQANAQSWSYMSFNYDAQNRLDSIQVSYDDGALYAIDYDQANAQSWSYMSFNYDAQNRLDSIQVSYDDGALFATDYDQANAQSWSYLSYVYDAQSHLDYTQVSYDDGSLVATDYDQANAQPWSYVSYAYDPQSRLDYSQVGSDDGSLVAIDYDQANTANWSDIYYTYDPQGTLVSTLVHWDV